MTETQTVLELRGLTTGYDAVPVVRDVDMAIARGTLTSVIGPNGAGKSTALKAAVGLLRPWKGHVMVNGRDVTGEAAHLRVSHGLAYVPQGRIVLPEMTVLENLEIGGFTIRNNRGKLRESLERVTTLFPVLAERRDQRAGTMSGGEQQMLAIGRALMTVPDIIVLDEPSLGLSPKFVDIVFAKLVELKEAGYTVVMVEQKASRALEISDWGFVLFTGLVIFRGPAAQLLANDEVKRLYLGELPEEAEALLALADAGEA